MLCDNPSNKKRMKRKVEDEHLESSLPKHKFKSYHDPPLFGHRQVEESLTSCSDEMESSDGVTQHMESVSDSNSFAGETDSTASLDHDGRFNPEFLKAYGYDQPSTSSTSYFSSNSSSTDCLLRHSCDSKDVTTSGSDKPMNYNSALKLQPQNPEYPGIPLSGDDQQEQYSDAEGIDDVMLDADSSEKPNTYILSSGRWTINRESRFSSKKPTIDEEFEQYFSMLML